MDQAINYARNPEKTTETYQVKQAALHTIDGVVQYAADDMKTEQRCYVTGINCREDTAAKQFMETKEFWSRVTGQDKFAGRVCFHGYQSFAEGEVDAQTAHEIGVKLATQLWGDRFEVIVATHCNTDNYHNHIIINSVSWSDGYKFDNRPSDYREMREVSDRLCRQYNLSVIEEPAGRGKNYSEYLAEQNGKPTARGLIREDIDRAVRASVTEREFFSHLEDMGYTFKIYGERGKPLKYPSLKPPGANGFFRFHKLGEGYSLDDINERILKNRRRVIPFPDEERETVRQYRERTEPRPKVRGIQALYIRYCYELHIIQKFPASVKRVSFFMREDLAHMERLNRQAVLLAENHIETMEDLIEFRTKTAERLPLLEQERADLRNELKRANWAGSTEKAEEVKGRIAAVSSEMKVIRDTVKLCGSIEARSRPMEEELKKLMETQKEDERKVKKEDEQLLWRRGRSGREDDPRRY